MRCAYDSLPCIIAEQQGPTALKFHLFFLNLSLIFCAKSLPLKKRDVFAYDFEEGSESTFMFIDMICSRLFIDP